MLSAMFLIMSLFLHLNRRTDNLCRGGRDVITGFNDDSLLANPIVRCWCLVGQQDTNIYYVL